MKEQPQLTYTKCPECGLGQLVTVTRTEEYDFDLGDEVVKVRAENVPVEKCEMCGQVISGPAAAKVRHEALCRTAGLLTPADIKAIRDKFRWSQEHLAELTGFGVATVSRWERGRLLQNRSSDKFLRVIRDCPEARECLIGLLQPIRRTIARTTTALQRKHLEKVRELIPDYPAFSHYLLEDGQMRVMAWGGEYGWPVSPTDPGWPAALASYCKENNLDLSFFEVNYAPLRPQMWDDEVEALTTLCKVSHETLDEQPTVDHSIGTIIRLQIPPCAPATVPDSVLDANLGQARKLLERAEQQRANGEMLDALVALADALEEAGYTDPELFTLCRPSTGPAVGAFWRLVGRPVWAKPAPVAREDNDEIEEAKEEADDPLDLSPLVFDRVDRKGRALVLNPPLSVTPTFDEESSQLLVAEAPDLGLQACAATREALVDAIVEQLFFLWDEYALEDPKKLSPAAERLRGVLQARMRESRNAS